MVTSFIVAGALFIVSSFVVGTTEALWLAGLYLGFAFLVTGILMIFNRPFREKYYRTYMNDPEGDKLLTEKQKNFFDRYYFPPKAIMAGIGLIFLYWVTHQELFASIVNWVKGIF